MKKLISLLTVMTLILALVPAAALAQTSTTPVFTNAEDNSTTYNSLAEAWGAGASSVTVSGGDYVLADGDVPAGKTVTLNVAATISGAVTVSGTLVSTVSLTNSGTLANNGTITSTGTLVNSGGCTLTNGGTITSGTFTNDGTLTNNGRITTTGAFSNNLSLTNNGTIDGSITNAVTGVLTNKRTITNGTVTNSGTIENTGNMHAVDNVAAGNVYNHGSITTAVNENGGRFITYLSGITNRTGTFDFLYEAPVYNYYTLTVYAGTGGKASPNGKVSVEAGKDSPKLTFTPDKGYEIAGVYVDGKYQGTYNTYMITDVDSDHSIEVRFTKTAVPTGYTIKIVASTGGVVSPSGTLTVAPGKDSEHITITPAEGYTIGAVYVDGKQVETSTGYTFSAVTADHVMEVFFAQGASGGVDTPQTGENDAIMIFAAALALLAMGCVVLRKGNRE